MQRRFEGRLSKELLLRYKKDICNIPPRSDIALTKGYRTLTSPRGKIHTVKRLIAYFYLKYLRRNTKRRLTDQYDIRSEDIFKLGVLIPPIERTFEFPRNDLEQKTDNLLIFGVNSEKEQLIVRISRTSTEYANIWVYLRLSNGKIYVHSASEKHFKIPKTSNDTFAAGGLRLRCINPMRKWRISYNGMLSESTDTEKDGQSVYVKFSFVWTTSSKLVDFSTDISLSILSNCLASQNWDGWLPDINRLLELEKYLDAYEQSGMMWGTVAVQGQDEREIYLWGGRQHSIVPVQNGVESLDFFGILKEGDYFHVSRIHLPGQDKPSFDYGCIMMPTGFIHVMDDFELVVPEAQETDPKLPGAKITFKRDKVQYKINVGPSAETQVFGSKQIHFSPVTMEDDEGQAMIVHYLRESVATDKPVNEISTKNHHVSKVAPLVAKITDLSYKDVNIAGGKGASLGQLSTLSLSHNNFSVPKGIVITTKAYKEFIKQSTSNDAILELQDAAWKENGDLKEACQRTVTKMTGETLPAVLETAIKTKLEELFGKDFHVKKFAVRSSALGEDSEDLSAAGQMETILGVRGLQEVLKAVAKCWASQFSYTAIQYKRQYGQLLNTLMAVVVQEMVPADSAGVTFTCDPINGNPSFVTVTANYGLGESVVSASAEPDTLVYERNDKDQLMLHSMEIGKKSTKIVMTDSIGVEEKDISEQESHKCCISSEIGLLLSRVAIQVEDCFGCSMDIEWAVKDNKVYLLQARPVTTFDRETDFEIKHEMDGPLSCEKEYTTKANLGEVMPGAMSHLGMSMMYTISILFIVKKYSVVNEYAVRFNPFLWKDFVLSQNHVLMNVLNLLLSRHMEDGSKATECRLISFCGRILDDPEMMTMALRRNKKDTLKKLTLLNNIYILGDYLFGARRLEKAKKIIHSKDIYIDLQECNSAEDIFMKIMQDILRLQYFLWLHGDSNMASTTYNHALLTVLCSAKGGWHNDVYKDFASLVSNCSGVESADIPCAIEVS